MATEPLVRRVLGEESGDGWGIVMELGASNLALGCNFLRFGFLGFWRLLRLGYRFGAA